MGTEERVAGSAPAATIDLGRIDAVVFDLDGVLTDTAVVHAAAWKHMFDAYLQERAARTGSPLVAFTTADYERYVDGLPRLDGVRSFLASRSIVLPAGGPDDPPDAETVRALGNRKNTAFLTRLAEDGAQAYPSTVPLLRTLRRCGVRTAVVSASRNCAAVVAAAGLDDLFDTRVDGTDLERLGLPGKPAPAMFLEALLRLGVEPDRAAAVEDAEAGVEAARRGRFALVVGVDRTGHAAALRARGADVVIDDLADLVVAPPPRPGHGVTALLRQAAGELTAPDSPLAALPDALERPDELRARLAGRTPAVFLDYDGTLTPIVADPDEALLPTATGAVLRRLAARCPVAILSGRDLDDVHSKIDVDGISYAGSHGFDILVPDGTAEGRRQDRGADALPALDEARQQLDEQLGSIPGVRVERKRFAIAVHFRNASGQAGDRVETAARAAAARIPGLRVTGGKKIWELRPDVDWDKGRALRFLLGELGLDRPDVVPVYVGDDETDEDAFRAVHGRGLGLVVRGEVEDRPTAATAALSDPDAVRHWLEQLLEILEEGQT